MFNVHQGFSLLMFCGTIWSLTFGRTRKEVNKLMVTIATLLLVLSTTVSDGSFCFSNLEYSLSLAHYYGHIPY